MTKDHPERDLDRLRFLWLEAGRHAIVRYGLPIVLVVVTAVLRLVVAPEVSRSSPFLLSAAIVLASALVGGLGPGMVATVVLAALALLDLPPVGELAVGDTVDAFRIGLFLVEGLFVAFAGTLLRRQLMERRRAARVARAPVVDQRADIVTPQAAEPPLAEPLSTREVEVMRHVAAGLRNDEIAGAMFITTNTVKSHLAHAYAKLEVTNRTQAVARCAALGLLEPSTSEPHERER
jgi:DNA-binding CsgD family transcriptional regulator